MKTLLIRCYPARWRARHGEEFTAVLEEHAVGHFDVADILLGALDAHLRLHGSGAVDRHERGFSVSLRIGGIAAILGATSLAVAGFLSFGLVAVDEVIAAVLLVVGLVALLVALTGLSAFQARIHPRLIWTAFAVTAVGAISSIVGWIGSTSTVVGDRFWGIWFLGVMAALLGSALFAVATSRTAALSRGAAVLLGVGSVLPFASLGITSFELLGLAAVICLLLGWFGLGVQAIRLDRPTTEARPA